jgi:hypothetical protein
VTPPTGSSGPKIDPFGTRYDERTGKCIEDAGWLPNDCDTTKSLEDEARNKAKAIETATGAARERLMLELARIEAILAARKALGNDRLADQYIGRIERSNLYDSLKDNPRAKTMLWAGLAETLNTGKYKQFVGNSVQAYLSLVVRAAQNLRVAGFDSSGNPRLVETSGSSGNSSVDPSLAAGAGGAARGQTGRVPGAVGVGIIVLGIGVAGQAVELAGPVLRDLFGRGRAVISSFSEWEKANQARRDAEVGTRAAAGSPDPNDPCNGYKPNLKIVGNNARANKIAEGAGIQGTISNGAAEELKKLYVGASGARFNLAFDKNTGRIWLEPVRRGEGNLIPTDYFTDGTFEPFDPEKGKC